MLAIYDSLKTRSDVHVCMSSVPQRILYIDFHDNINLKKQST